METLLLTLCAVVTIASVFISINNNSDVFSPSKVYILFNVVFFLDVYFGEYDILIICTYLIQCLIVLSFSIYDKQNNKLDFSGTGVRTLSGKVVLCIWLISSVSIVNQIVVIIEFGNIFNYISNIALRVEYYKGKGYILVLNSIVATINVIYFTYLLSSKSVSLFHKKLFIAHFVIFVCMALLSGSRSFLLITILVEIIAYNYICKPLNLRKLFPFFVAIICLSALIGGVRNSLDTTDNQVKIKGDSLETSSTHFKYGLIPLELIHTQEVSELTMGTTYLATITNFIPRAIFPQKFDSGGVAFTKLYTGNRWEGRSNLATGAVAEGVLNFGMIPGTVFGFISLIISYFFGMFLYRRMLRLRNNDNNYTVVIVYIYLILAVGRYPYSEFAYTYYTFILYVLIPVVLIKVLSKVRLR